MKLDIYVGDYIGTFLGYQRIKFEWGLQRMKAIILLYYFMVITLLTAFLLDNAIYADVGKIPTPPSNLTITSEPPPSQPPPSQPPPPGNDGLLVGMTPSNYTIPSGWTLVRKQDFENGSIKSDEWFTPGTEITSTRAHGGGNSSGGRYTSDASDVRWGMSGNSVGPYNDIYISFWDFTESQARFNTEYFQAFLEKQWGSGNYQNFIFNTFMNSNGEFNATSVLHVFQGEGYSDNPATFTKWGPNRTIPTGRWVQKEFWFHPNTSGNSDGFARWYEDGTLVHSVSNQNLNGNIDMGSANVQVGGVYTKHIWRRADGSCGAYEGDGTGYERETNWDNCTCPNQCPPNGTVPKFYRYLDDILIMKR